MSSANLDLVRSIFAAWERGDWSAAEWADPNIEFQRAGDLTGGRWTGSAGMAEGSTREAKAFNAAVWTFRDGKVVGFDAYADRAPVPSKPWAWSKRCRRGHRGWQP